MDLRAVLVDDEQLARDELGYLLGQIGGVEVIGQAGNGVEALTTIERLQPDVVFLDVQMPGLTGFEVARRMLDARAAVAHHLRHRLRSARDRGVRGQRGRLPAEAGRPGAARGGASSGRGGGSRRRGSLDGGRRRVINDQLEKIVAARRRTPEPARAAGHQGRRTLHAGAGGGDHLRLAGRRGHHRRDEPAHRDVELPDARRTARAARPAAFSGACTDRIW